MHAVQLHEYGGPELLRYEEVERPVAGDGEVLVRVAAAGINPVDWKRRRGRGELPLPLILGWEISGAVEEPRSERFETGDEVFGLVRFPDPGNAYAEFVAAPAAELAPKPRTLDHVQAAAVPLAALTAWQALFDTAGLTAEETVLVHAAAGGVGHFATQLASGAGARVVGTASARNEDFVRGLGADEFVDYTSQDFAAAVSGIDVVLDAVGGDVTERSLSVLGEGGRLVTIAGDVPEDAARERGIRAERILVHPDGAQLERIGALIDAGDLSVEVAEVVPLAQAARAHELSEAGHTRGKIVLDVASA